MIRRGPAAALAAVCVAAASLGVTARAPAKERPARRIWGPAETVSFWSGALTRSIDGDGSRLRGFFVAREIFDEAEADMGGGLWLSSESGNGQNVLRTGFDFRATLLKIGPLRLAPRFALGVEGRRRGPDKGIDGLVAPGLELGVWLGETVQLALFADRDLAFRSPTRNQVGIVLRIGRLR